MKYQPKNKEELQALCNDESVYLGDIDTSLITDMSGLFYGSSRTEFSGIESWDVSSVVDMSGMFEGSEFNQSLDSWDVGSVEFMDRIFADSLFNQPLSSWNVSSVKTMREMFANSPFNQPLSLWDVSNVVNMESMFEGSEFNQPLDSWDVSNVEVMNGMFANSPFNQPLYSWKLREDVDNSHMFANTSYSYPVTHLLPKGSRIEYLMGSSPYAFPLDFSSYPKTYAPKSKEVLKLIVNDRAIPLYSIDVRGVKDMSYLFKGCLREDWEYAGIESWDMSGVESVEGMFEGCKYQHSKRFFELQGIKGD